MTRPRRSHGQIDAMVLGWLRDHPGFHTHSDVRKQVGLASSSLSDCVKRLHPAGKIKLGPKGPRGGAPMIAYREQSLHPGNGETYQG